MRKRSLSVLAALFILAGQASVAHAAVSSCAGDVDYAHGNRQWVGVQKSSSSLDVHGVHAGLSFNGAPCTGNIFLTHPSAWIALEPRTCTSPCNPEFAILQIGILHNTLPNTNASFFVEWGGCPSLPDPVTFGGPSFLSTYYFRIFKYVDGATHNDYYAVEYSGDNVNWANAPGTPIPFSNPNISCWASLQQNTEFEGEAWDSWDSLGSASHQTTWTQMQYQSVMGGGWNNLTDTTCQFPNPRTVNPWTCTHSGTTLTVHD